jgi:hypothetical protein
LFFASSTLVLTCSGSSFLALDCFICLSQLGQVSYRAWYYHCVNVVKPGELLTRHVGIELSSLWIADEQSQLHSFQLAILIALG